MLKKFNSDVKMLKKGSIVMLYSNNVEQDRMMCHPAHHWELNPRSMQPIFFFSSTTSDQVELTSSSSSNFLRNRNENALQRTNS